jgi:hypothetical protein
LQVWVLSCCDLRSAVISWKKNSRSKISYKRTSLVPVLTYVTKRHIQSLNCKLNRTALISAHKICPKPTQFQRLTRTYLKKIPQDPFTFKLQTGLHRSHLSTSPPHEKVELIFVYAATVDAENQVTIHILFLENQVVERTDKLSNL